MKLYTANATPFGRTVSMVARELGLHQDIEAVTVKVVPGQANPDFQAINPLRKIPALVLADGETIIDSAVICEFLAARVGDTALMARGTPQEWAVKSQYALARGMTECAVAARYEVAARPEDKRWQVWIDDQMEKISAGLKAFDANPPAHSGRLTISEISLAALLGYLDFRFAPYDWRGRFRGLNEWFVPIESRESFQATKPAG